MLTRIATNDANAPDAPPHQSETSIIAAVTLFFIIFCSLQHVQPDMRKEFRYVIPVTR